MKHSLKTEPLHFAFDVSAKRAVADEESVGARDAFMQTSDRAHKVERIFVPNELRHLDDQRSTERNAERNEDVSRNRCYRSLCVNTIRDDMNSAPRNSTSLEHTRDRIRDRDDRVGTAILPARARIRSQWEVDPSRDDEPHRCPNGRERADGDRVGRVRVHDVDVVCSNVAAQAECGSRVDLEARIAFDNAESLFFRSRFERLTTASRNDRDASPAGERPSEPERLSLTAPPSTLRIDMQHAIAHGAQLPWTGHYTQASFTTSSALATQ